VHITVIIIVCFVDAGTLLLLRMLH